MKLELLLCEYMYFCRGNVQYCGQIHTKYGGFADYMVLHICLMSSKYEGGSSPWLVFNFWFPKQNEESKQRDEDAKKRQEELLLSSARIARMQEAIMGELRKKNDLDDGFSVGL